MKEVYDNRKTPLTSAWTVWSHIWHIMSGSCGLMEANTWGPKQNFRFF